MSDKKDEIGKAWDEASCIHGEMECIAGYLREAYEATDDDERASAIESALEELDKSVQGLRWLREALLKAR